MSARVEASVTRKKGKLSVGRKWSHQTYLESLIGKDVTITFLNEPGSSLTGEVLNVDQYTMLIMPMGRSKGADEPILYFKAGIETVDLA